MSNSFLKLFELVKPERLRDSTNNKNDVLSVSGSDKGRIVNSSAFRRLQQKAQVFPLDDNAAVRTRLTHSVEVSQVGGYLAQEVIKRLDKKFLKYNDLVSFVNNVESSCLLHDIGNPPFGHLGEAAIRKWACGFYNRKNNWSNEELKFFDGNAQGLRFSTFLGGRDNYGLNLSVSLILSSIKYPVTYKENDTGRKDKSGIFENEKEKYLRSCDKLNWMPKKVFPMAKLMEAADDISYCMSDLEDGLEKGVITDDMLCNEFFEYKKIFCCDEKIVSPFIKFKTDLINSAVSEAATVFVENIDEILDGNKVDLISKESGVGIRIDKIKKFAAKEIYSNDAVEKIEIAGNSTISGILKSFDSILSLSYDEFLRLKNGDASFIRNNNLEFDHRLFKRLPQSYIEKYDMGSEERSKEEEIADRLHLVTDFVAGMTDSFSVYFYQVISGIKMR